LRTDKGLNSSEASPAHSRRNQTKKIVPKERLVKEKGTDDLQLRTR
jgi:hypothetical protein